MAVIARCSCGHGGFVSRALGPTRFRHRLHGDDRQPAIWLDAFRQSDRSEISLGHRRDTVGVQRLHCYGNLAGADRGLVCRPVRPARRGRAAAASSSPSPGRSIPLPSSLWELYIAAAISGIGAGAVYGTCVGNALKWFPDLRGLAAGLTAAGFGAGTAATVDPDPRHDHSAMATSPRFSGSGSGKGSSL